MNKIIKSFLLFSALILISLSSCNFNNKENSSETIVSIYIEEPFLTAGRTASVILPKNVWYEVSAKGKNGGQQEEIAGVQDEGTQDYSVKLPKGASGSWTFYVEGFDSNDTSSRKKILEGQKETEVRSGERYDLSIPVNFINNYNERGSVDLVIDVSETGITSLMIEDAKYKEFKEKYPTKNGFINIKEDSISACTHNVDLLFYKDDVLICKIPNESINVRQDMTTKTWIKSGKSEYLFEIEDEPELLSEDVESEVFIPTDRYNPVKAEFKITKAYIYNKMNNFCYVSSTSGNDKNTGSKQAPLATLQQAIKRSVALGEEYPVTDKKETFTIYIDGAINPGELPADFDGNNTTIIVQKAPTATAYEIKNEIKLYNKMDISFKGITINSLNIAGTNVSISDNCMVKGKLTLSENANLKFSSSTLGTDEAESTVTVTNSSLDFAKEQKNKNIFIKEFTADNSTINIANSKISGDEGCIIINNGSSITMDSSEINVAGNAKGPGVSIKDSSSTITNSTITGNSLVFSKCKSVKVVSSTLTPKTSVSFESTPNVLISAGAVCSPKIDITGSTFKTEQNEDDSTTNLFTGTISITDSDVQFVYCDIGTGFTDARADLLETDLSVKNSNFSATEVSFGNERNSDSQNNFNTFEFINCKSEDNIIEDSPIYLKGIAPKITNTNITFKYLEIIYTNGKGYLKIDNTDSASKDCEVYFVDAINYGHLEVTPTANVYLEGLSPVEGTVYLTDDAIINVSDIAEDYKDWISGTYFATIFHSNPIWSRPVVYTEGASISLFTFKIITPGVSLSKSGDCFIISHLGSSSSKYLLYQEIQTEVDYQITTEKEKIGSIISKENARKYKVYFGVQSGNQITSPSQAITYLIYNKDGENIAAFSGLNSDKKASNEGINLTDLLPLEAFEAEEYSFDLKVLVDVAGSTYYQVFPLTIK